MGGHNIKDKKQMGLQITRNGPDSEPDYEICIQMRKFVRWSDPPLLDISLTN